MLTIDIENASSTTNIPESKEFEQWVKAALQAPKDTDIELSIRIVDEEEIQTLNRDYRGKDKPTNILSFPCELPPGVDVPLLGDLVICANVVKNEAKEQEKPEQNHWAHMVIHGTLHLMGYDHSEDTEAEIMEALEVKLLSELGISNPYALN